jgi:hypothetical protein
MIIDSIKYLIKSINNPHLFRVNGCWVEDDFDIDLQQPVFNVLTGKHKGATIRLLHVSHVEGKPKWHVSSDMMNDTNFIHAMLTKAFGGLNEH